MGPVLTPNSALNFNSYHNATSVSVIATMTVMLIVTTRVPITTVAMTTITINHVHDYGGGQPEPQLQL